MLKQEIIDKITKYFKLTHYEAEKIYDDIFQSIMKGVKDDNITDVSNLGEFISKNNENDTGGFKKTVEFLPSSNLMDEISGAVEYKQAADTTDEEKEIQQEKPALTDEPPETNIRETVPDIKDEKSEEIESPQTEDQPPEKEIPAVKPEDTISPLSVEEEIKRKRDEIIHKLDPEHQEKYQPLLHVSEGINLNVPKPVVIKEPEVKPPEKEKAEITAGKEVEEEKPEDITRESKDITDEIKEDIKKEKEAVEEITAKTFSDYFTEVKEEQKAPKEPLKVPPVMPVIPPVAVDLHKEIMGDKPVKPPEDKKTLPQDEKQAGNGYSSDVGSKGVDNSYYIWYKDSEPNAVDTQTMSYEYELLYQATKEAEYKSKLRIYVTTFILFFSIVLLLLIFSPVIYKYFFTPVEEQSIEQVVPEEESSNTTENDEVTTVSPPVQNTTPEQEKQQTQTQQMTSPEVNYNTEQKNIPEQKTVTPPPAANNEQKQQSEPPPSQQQSEPPPSQQQSTTRGFEGIIKTGLGWMDEKNKVIYVQLENGKFTIQESAWDSNEKANKRISAVSAYNISGLTGTVFKIDLGSKGIWYRARFGEFSTIDEAKQKAEELRNREKIKLQAFLMSILLFA